MSNRPLTFGSLFAGIGGFDLGFERAGMQCKWQVEIDDYANKVLAKHWPNVTRWRDVRTFPPKPESPWLGADWRAKWGVDVICGGFPCQDISYAGKGAGLAGERSGLFFDVIRIVREMGPSIVVLENVAALLTRGLDQVLGTLASIGYDAEWHCIPAAAVGAPHIRDRVFILAYAQSMGLTAGCGIKRNKTQPRKRRRKSARGREVLADADSSFSRASWASEAKERPANMLIDGSSRTAGNGFWRTEPDVVRVANGIPARVDRLRGLGNAVVPQVAEYIGRMIVEAVK